MKKSILTLIIAFVAAFTTMAQMASPAATAEGTIDGVKIKIAYSQPSARGRKMIGGVDPYGKVWRTGANETTSIEFSAPVKIEGKSVAAGKYALFTIPGENEWVIIINTGYGKMGAYDYKESEDVIRATVKPTKTSAFVETFNIAVEKTQIVMKWENVQVAVKVSK